MLATESILYSSGIALDTHVRSVYITLPTWIVRRSCGREK